MAFGGTLTLSLPTLHALLRDICRSVIRASFSRILIVNGHGGNMTAVNALTTELAAELSTPIAFASYFGSGREGGARVASPEKGERMLAGCAAALAGIIVRDPWAK
ncbi:hypothetical protein SSP24_04200 [Streptomyces spinoverrucosus]|uniref:Creatinine amidohydrolase n=1 Tax=Streptomyces spinoverrucosus TaxID=284043 RepID=A0A4Y3V8L0_9ACTN|nr:creatininase family protein [Streptomyces spinoverrucosus]GEC02765.1 hypothetical protein SSP24_04200 [Streptomyces spinoverrucosus]GHB40631.1 hypothetical protein GCM10010397_08400 [Streptomyces spinoverrucosus]